MTDDEIRTMLCDRLGLPATYRRPEPAEMPGDLEAREGFRKRDEQSAKLLRDGISLAKLSARLLFAVMLFGSAFFVSQAVQSCNACPTAEAR